MQRPRVNQPANPEIDNGPHEQELAKLLAKDYTAELKKWGFNPEEIRRCRELIRFFIEGMTDTYRLKKRQNRIPAGFQVPSVLLSDQYGMAATCSRRQSGQLEMMIFIHPDLLRNVLPASIGGLIKMENVIDPALTNWYGPVEIFFQDVGREEMDHTILTYEEDLKGIRHQALPVATTRQTEYDTEWGEYRALGTRIRQLIDDGAPSETIEVLQQRLRAAILERHRQKIFKKYLPDIELQ